MIETDKGRIWMRGKRDRETQVDQILGKRRILKGRKFFLAKVGMRKGNGESRSSGIVSVSELFMLFSRGGRCP